MADRTGGDYVQAELDIRERLAGHDLDFAAMAAVSNIYRAATAVRNHMERTVLACHDLSWTAFTVLFCLWIWGDQESRHLAARAGISKGTLTGVVTTLERRGLCWREPRDTDRRLVVVGLSEEGRATIEGLFPLFNEQEAAVTKALSSEDKAALASQLRVVIATLDDAKETPPAGEASTEQAAAGAGGTAAAAAETRPGETAET